MGKLVDITTSLDGFIAAQTTARGPVALEQTRVLDSPKVTHLQYRFSGPLTAAVGRPTR